MTNSNKKNERLPALRELYPNFTEEQLEAAEENLDRYLTLVLRIYDRITQDPEAHARLRKDLSALTRRGQSGGMEGQRSNINI